MLAFVRAQGGQRVVVIANFSEQEQVVAGALLDRYSFRAGRKLHGLSRVPDQGDLAVAALDFLVVGDVEGER